MAWLGGPLQRPAARVVSLVPSLTESVMRLGGSVIGRTSFCPGEAEIVGGPKDAAAERIVALAPDLVVASRSENARATVEAVARVCAVWLCDPRRPDDAPGLWRELGEILGRRQEAARVAQQTRAELDDAHRLCAARGAGSRFVCWVWRQPWIAAGPDSWISAMLETAGLVNAAPAGDYPRVLDPGAVDAQLHLLPSEPYAFSDEDVTGLGGGTALEAPGWFRLTNGALAALVPGEPLIWYPSHTVAGLALARKVREMSERL